ncbi:MAG: M56 family metallopeptidase [Acidobacteriota bacterium]
MWNPLTETGFTHAAALSVQVGLLVALVYGLSFLVRRGPAEVRYVLWLTVALRLFWPAGLESPVGLAPALGVERPGAATSRDLGAGSETLGDPSSAGAQASRLVAAAATPGVAGDSSMPPLVAAWLVGVALLSFHFARRGWQARRFVAACAPNRRQDLAQRFNELRSELGLPARVELRLTSAKAPLQAPAVFGLLRPVVLLPSSMAEEWSLDEIEPVLIHEMVHLKRLDLPVNALQHVLQVVYFFHPLVWLMNWKIRQERELICDDEVVRRCGGRTGYVRAILRVAESQCSATRVVPAMAMASRPSSLARRVERLLDRGYRQVERRRGPAVGAFLLGLLCVGIVSGRSRAAAATPELAWSAEAEALFALDPGENLRLVDPATFGSRLELYRALHPAQAALVPEGPQRISLTWDAATRRFEPPRFSFGQATLGQLLHLLGVESHDVAGATAWLSAPVVGDLVVRGGADLETLLVELQAELVEHRGLPLRLNRHEVVREVVVARGRYRVSGGPVRVAEPVAESSLPVGECRELAIRGLDASLRQLSGLLDQPVIDKVDAIEANRVEWLFSPFRLRDPNRLLADLAAQTSLRFDREEQRRPTVFISETAAGAGG